MRLAKQVHQTANTRRDGAYSASLCVRIRLLPNASLCFCTRQLTVAQAQADDLHVGQVGHHRRNERTEVLHLCMCVCVLCCGVEEEMFETGHDNRLTQLQTCHHADSTSCVPLPDNTLGSPQPPMEHNTTHTRIRAHPHLVWHAKLFCNLLPRDQGCPSRSMRLLL